MTEEKDDSVMVVSWHYWCLNSCHGAAGQDDLKICFRFKNINWKTFLQTSIYFDIYTFL